MSVFLAVIATLTFLVVVGVRLLKSRCDRVSVALILVMVGCHYYVLQPLLLSASGQLESFLSTSNIIKSELISLFMMSAFFFGWFRSARSKAIQPTPLRVSQRESTSLYKCGAVLASVGLVLQFVWIYFTGGIDVFYGAAHGVNATWEQQSTAYLYYAPWWINAGLVMMLTAFHSGRKERWQLLLIILSVVVFATHALLIASRAMVFTGLITLFVTFVFSRGILPSVRATCLFLGGAAVLVLCMLVYRSILHLGEKREEAPGLAEAISRIYSIDSGGVSQRTTGVEFIYQTGLIDAVEHTGTYILGLDYLHAVTIQVIPRLLWPERPYAFDVARTSWQDIQDLEGFNVAAGSAPTLVGDLFSNFGYASVVVWFLLGWGLKKMHVRSQIGNEVMPRLAYVIVFNTSVFLFAQDFRQFLLFSLYSLIPIWILTRVYVTPNRRVARPLLRRLPTSSSDQRWKAARS